MGKRYINGLMSQREILSLFRRGVYSVDLDEGVVMGRNGKPLKTYLGGAEEGSDGRYQFVALYDAESGRRKDIAVHRIVWMVGCNTTVPKDFEVHHEDEDTDNNGFFNLFALHKVDHKKVHSAWLPEEPDDTPF